MIWKRKGRGEEGTQEEGERREGGDAGGLDVVLAEIQRLARESREAQQYAVIWGEENCSDMGFLTTIYKQKDRLGDGVKRCRAAQQSVKKTKV